MWSSSADFSSCLVLMAFTAKTSFFLWRGCLIPSSWKWKMETAVKSQQAAQLWEVPVSEWRFSTGWSLTADLCPLPWDQPAATESWPPLPIFLRVGMLSGWWVGRNGGKSSSHALVWGEVGASSPRAHTFSMSWGVAVSKVWPEVTHCLAKITYWARPKSSSHVHTRSVLHWAKGALASLEARNDPVSMSAWAPSEHNSASQKGTRFKQTTPIMGSSWTTTYSFKIDSWVSWDNTWWESQICSCSELGAVTRASGSYAQERHWWCSGQESACQCRGHRRYGFDVGKIPWNRKWQPIPVFLPGKSHGQRSLEGYSPWCHKESDMTEVLNTHIHRKLCSHKHAWTYIHTHIHAHLNQSQLGFRSTPESCFTQCLISFLPKCLES